MSGAGAPIPGRVPADLDRYLAFAAELITPDPAVARAAVLAVFDPFALSPAGTPSDAAERDRRLKALLPRCEAITAGPDHGLWTLTLSERRMALRAMVTRASMRLAVTESPERRMTAQQRMFEDLINSVPIDLTRLGRDDLAALAAVHGWVDGILDAIPDLPAIRSALGRADLFAPMLRLATSHFVGRDRELDQLRAYVSGPPPQTPLFVYGAGGVGKSTLLARFVLTDLEALRMPVAYLDIDRPNIRPERPLTLLLDALAQLQIQLDVPAHTFEGMRKEISYALGRLEGGRELESIGTNFQWVLPMVGGALAQWLHGRTVVLIVDTLEEAQFLGADVMGPLMDFLLGLGNTLKEFRLILSGRTLPREFVQRALPVAYLANSVSGSLSPEEESFLDQVPLPYRPINLGVLDDMDAPELLRGLLADAELPPLTEAELVEVICVVTRNPMCIRLAARLLRDEGVDSLRADRTNFLAKLKAEKIQAMLYGRILRSVHGDTVKVAYPGLVVRRITPEVIREVLAEPCKLDLTPEHDEYAIFDQLRHEAALVYVDPMDGSLRHRPDVRRVMLADLTDQVTPEVVAAIDQWAVAFYENSADPVARAEEIYHRLRLDEPEEVLNARWVPAAAAYLKGAVEELPARQQLWLGARLGVTLDPAVRQTATQETWESQAVQSADRYLTSRQPEQALEVLHERTDRLPRSRLYALESEAYRLAKRPDDALHVARAGVDSAVGDGAIDMAVSLLLKMVTVEEGRGDLIAAERLLEECAALAAHSTNDVLRFRTLVTRLRLQRQLRPADVDERTKLREEALASLTDTMVEKLRTHPVTLREVAAELGKQHAGVSAAALQTLGVETVTDAQASSFGEALLTLNQGLEDQRYVFERLERAPNFSIDETAEPRVGGLNAAEVRKWVSESLTAADTRRLGRALNDASAETLDKFRDYFRSGVSSALRGD